MSQRAMFTAISGIRNHAIQMDVIANNIANSGTMGFKRGRMTFEESFALLLQGASRPPGDQGGVNPLQIGNGSSIGSIDNVITQGNIQSTGNQTDLAIRGDGFFVVSNDQRDFFSRAGSFQWDAEGRLVIPFNGMKVQGRIANEDGIVNEGSPIGDVTVPFGTVDVAKPSSEVSFVGNLDASAEPDGNILSTQRLYAREISGETTNMNGLYANGSANLQITGLSSNSTTVTVSASNSIGGNAITQTYTYVSTDTGVSSKDFHSLDDLIAEINTDFSTGSADPSVTASVTAAGAINLVNNGAANNTLVLSSVNSVLNKALAAANGVIAAGTGNDTDEFSHVANSLDALTNLRDQQGNDLELELTDTVSIAGRVGGTQIDSVTGGNADPFEVTVDDGSGVSITFGDFAQEIKDAFGITNQKGIAINEVNGSLVVNADGGTANEITAMDITSGVGNVFDGVFDATIGNWQESRSAKDVTHSAAVRVFDSLGNNHTLTLNFKKDVRLPNRWVWDINVPEPAELSGGYTGSLSFNSSGALDSFSYSQGASSFTFDPKTGADVPMDIVLKFGTVGEADGISQFSSTSTVIAKDQDGYSAGVLDNVVIDDTGTITGLFTNGNSRVLSKLVLATFNNPSGMLRIGDNVFDVSSNSGLPIYGLAGTSINAVIIPGAIEMSNVDIAEEFTNMIIAQRSFQANARTVTTSDEILQETVNMKR
ncbi:flagellar hook-basal body complex protein [Candidatus Latescibacterota bacterium]